MFLALLASFLLPIAAWSQAGAAGVITGRVSNEATSLYLEGAIVRLEGTGYSIHTARDGTFRLQAPAGSYTVVISYTGLDTQRFPVMLSPGETLRRDIALTSDVYRLEEFTVAGEREGSALAIQVQRMSTNVKNVVAVDTFGNPDQNPGELLQRMPGITVDTVGSEVRTLQVRGMGGAFGALMVDGNKATTYGSSNMTREVQLDSMGTANIESVELIKAPTPEMDADAIAGYVNMVTKRAFDRPPGRRISYTLGSIWKVREAGMNTPQKDVPGLDLFGVSYSDVFSILGGQNNIGLSIDAQHRQAKTLQEQMTHSYRTTGATAEEHPILQQLMGTRDFTVPTHHWSLGTNVDFKISDDSYAYVRLSTNKRFNGQTARQWDVLAGTNLNSYEPGWSYEYTRARPVAASVADIDTFNFTKKTYNYAATAGAEHKFGNGDWKLTYSANESYGTIWYPRNYRLHARATGIGWEVDRRNSDPTYPVFTQYAGPSLTDPASYNIRQLTHSDNKGSHTARGVRADLQRFFDTAVPTYLKAGVKLANENRNRNQNSQTWAYVGPTKNIVEFLDTDYVYKQAGGRYGPWPMMQVPFSGRPGDIQDFFRNNPDLWRRDHYAAISDERRSGAKAKLEETIGSAYIMGNVDFGQLRILGGLRVEETDTKGTSYARVLTPEESARRAAWVGLVTEDEARRRVEAEYPTLETNNGNYRNVFPGIHFVYEPIDGLLVRASFNTSITRPASNNILPGSTIDEELQRVVTGNPNLRPHYSDNFELGVERYFEPVGLIGVGFFLKEIQDYSRVLISQIASGPDNGFNGQYAGWELRQQENVGDARIRGFEVNYSQQFSFLPGFWRGFGAFANYTRLQAQGTFTTANFQTRLANMVPQSGNAGISYINYGFDVRALVNWRDHHYRGGNGVNSTYWEERWAVDLKLQYHFTRRFSAFLDVINIGDVPSREQALEFNRKAFRHTQGINFTAGIKGRL